MNTNVKKIVASVVTLVGAVALVAGGTGAFFNDKEVSADNSFMVGTVALGIDNESYYNGSLSSSTTWLDPRALNGSGLLFFNFKDLKPSDNGEDTISLHVNDNPVWSCMDLTLTSNDDSSSTEPELATGDAPDDPDNTWDGELAQNVNFIWWADDGDNVLEDGEKIISKGVQTLADLATTSGKFSVALADSQDNIWGEATGTPLQTGTTHYIGKAWCFGTLALNPVAQDNASTSGPLAGRGTGWTCDGKALGNQTQTDSATLDVAFRAVQARGQNDFICSTSTARLAQLTVIKKVINDNGGNNVVSDFPLFITNSVTIPVTSGATTTLAVGTYRVTEQGLGGYTGSFGGDCDVDGNITLNPGDQKTCIITNNDLPANILLTKNVINDNGGTLQPFNFVLRIDGSVAPQGSQVQVTSNTPHVINEDAKAGYTFQSITTLFSIPSGILCPAVLGGTVTLPEGATVICQINNNDNP